MRRPLMRLSSEARRWLIAAGGFIVGGVGLTLLWGIGWGLALVGLGVAIIALLYDPDRVRTP